MWDIKPRRVLLAVETADCEAAIQYAAREARTRALRCAHRACRSAGPRRGHRDDGQR